jgi:tetratricopeptide (TPR) repeat protein
MDEPARQTAQGNSIAQALGQGALAAVIQKATIEHATLPDSFLESFQLVLSDALSHRLVLQPQFIDLFEIIRNPKDVPAAIFRIDHGRGLAPYDVPYVKGREGVAESTLYGALLDSGGTLLVQSRAGLGKTREVAELASRLCDEGWAICVAKGAGDTHINALDAFPDDLRGSRVLFVLDDLHLRVGVGTTAQKPYSERLNAFLAFFESMMAPGEMRVIATARTEPHHQRQLGFDPSQPLWSRFKVYELPEFTLAGLQLTLVTLADQVGVQLDKAQAAQMVSNSDRTLRTLVENVKRSHQACEGLTLDRWLPSQGSTWEERFREARGRHPEIEKIYQALHLIREIGVPTRVAYVTNLGTKLADFDATSARDDLVDRGLLGLRSGLLDVFGDEQLADSLRAAGKIPPQLELQYEAVIESIVTGVEVEQEWLDDLAALVDGLSMRERTGEVEATAATVTARGLDSASFYLALAVAKARQGNHSGAEEDFALAIARGWDDAKVYFRRGTARALQGNYSGAEEDFTLAIARGMDDAEVYYLRGMAQEQQDNYAGAEEDCTLAIARGQDDAAVYFRRALVRYLQGNHSGVEEDFTLAIARGQDDAAVYYLRAWPEDSRTTMLEWRRTVP